MFPELILTDFTLFKILVVIHWPKGFLYAIANKDDGEDGLNIAHALEKKLLRVGAKLKTPLTCIRLSFHCSQVITLPD